MRRWIKVAKVTMCILVIGLLGFKDTGIFVRDYVATEDKRFEQSSEVTVIRDSGRAYMVYDGGLIYDVPKENILVTQKTTKNYKAKKETFMKGNDLTTKLREIKEDDIVRLEEIGRVDGYGLYKASDGLLGYSKNEDYEVVMEQVVNLGLAKASIDVKEGKEVYKVAEGDQVDIVDFKEGKYVLRDTRGKDFKVPEKDIQLTPQGTKRVSRGVTGRTVEPVVEKPVNNRDAQIEKVIKAAESKMGTRYLYGGTTSNGYDCSGFTLMAYRDGVGIGLNRVSQDQARNGAHVERGSMIRGDLVFFKTTPRNVGHVGIYLGDNKFIHASSGGGRVMVSSMTEAYYSSRYVTARRIIK